MLKEESPLLLIVDDDCTFCEVLSGALTKRGFNVRVSHNAEEAIASAQEEMPEYAVIDLKMPGDSGLMVVKKLYEMDAETKMVVLTGYASIATSVAAIKLGATHYLAKPVDADEIVQAFYQTEGNALEPIRAQPLSVNRLEWEHIQSVLAKNEGNISATARDLSMHRRTLQRKLNKYPVKE